MSMPNDATDASDRLWPLAMLVFLGYFMFQAIFFVQGYLPFSATACVTYAYRSLLAAFLFFAPLLWLCPRRWRLGVGGGFLILFLLATVCYFALIVAARPALAQANDRAEALSAGVNSLLRGEYPYLRQTNLGQPLSPLTASLLLALPAQLACGRPELMSLPLLGLALLGLAWQRRRTASPIPFPLLALGLVLNPLIIWELAWGSDLMWGAILLLLAALALDGHAVRLSALLFAAALCTRAAFFLLIPLWAMYLFFRQRSVFLRFTLWAGVAVLTLELPFVLWRPDVFFHVAPLGMSSDKLTLPAPTGDNLLGDLFNRLLPTGQPRTLIVTLGLLLLAGSLGWRSRTLAQLFLSMTLLLALSLFFMGPFFLVDYLVWLVFPLWGALVSQPATLRSCLPGAPVSAAKPVLAEWADAPTGK